MLVTKYSSNELPMGPDIQEEESVWEYSNSCPCSGSGGDIYLIVYCYCLPLMKFIVLYINNRIL